MIRRFPSRMYPSGNPQIDWGNPITRGLVNCIQPFPGRATITDLASQRINPWPDWVGSVFPGLTSTAFGYAPNYVSTASYMNAASPLNPFTNGFTALHIVKPTSSAPGASKVHYSWSNASNSSGVLVFQSSAGEIHGFARDNAGSTVASTSTEQILAGRTYVVVMRYNPSLPGGLAEWLVKINSGGRYSVTPNDLGAVTVPTRFGINCYYTSTPTIQGDSAFIGPWVWNRQLDENEIDELLADPFITFRAPAARRTFSILTPVNVDLDVAGGITIAGQSATVALGVALSSAGSVTIGGEDSTLATSAHLFAAIDVAGSVTIQGQDLDVLLAGDIAVDLDAGALTIAGQDCALTLTTTQEGGPSRRPERKRRKLRPDELPAMEVDINFLQPWQECAAVVVVSNSLSLQFEQEQSLLNSTAESVADVSIEVRQEVAALLASLSAVPLRTLPARAMPKSETARVRIAFEQPEHELAATVEIA